MIIDGEKKLIPRMYKPDGTQVKYPARSTDVIRALGKNNLASIIEIERAAHLSPRRSLHRGRNSREYHPTDVMAILNHLQQRPKRDLWIGRSLIPTTPYPELEGKDLQSVGTEIVMAPDTPYRRGNGWKIVIEEE